LHGQKAQNKTRLPDQSHKPNPENFYRNFYQGATVNDGALQGAQGTDLNELQKNNSSSRRGYRTLEGSHVPSLWIHSDQNDVQEDQEAMIMLGNGRLLVN
jgi:hypothetical protein